VENAALRMTWDEMFLINALIWSAKSHDSQTKHGCIIAKNNTILSTGYNGFIRDIDDSVLPTTRPEKYDFMIHAEHNAILNCARNGISTIGATAYITGEPCNNCLQYMWQAGITRVVYSDLVESNMNLSHEHTLVQSDIIGVMRNSNHTMKIEFFPKENLKNAHSELIKLCRRD
jgi:dCMP deaminase